MNFFLNVRYRISCHLTLRQLALSMDADRYVDKGGMARDNGVLLGRIKFNLLFRADMALWLVSAPLHYPPRGQILRGPLLHRRTAKISATALWLAGPRQGSDHRHR